MHNLHFYVWLLGVKDLWKMKFEKDRFSGTHRLKALDFSKKSEKNVNFLRANFNLAEPWFYFVIWIAADWTRPFDALHKAKWIQYLDGCVADMFIIICHDDNDLQAKGAQYGRLVMVTVHQILTGNVAADLFVSGRIDNSNDFEVRIIELQTIFFASAADSLPEFGYR